MIVALHHAPRRAALTAAAFAGLLLAGCSSGHVGEDWQCPLAAGGSCASVAAADPAVPKAGAVRAPASGQPIRLLPLERDREETAAAPVRDAEGQGLTPTRSCEAACGFGPFAWLARLFGGSDDSAPRSDGNAKSVTDDAAAAAMTPDSRSMTSDAALPAETPLSEAASGDDGLPTDDLRGDDLRTGEVVARIWIAPFVDAGGVYREGAWVRVVLEPAGWRLP
ncbi:MAG: TraV family lipoprotein [Rhodospirillaceae bacterium]|nr:TraV family lipoprotein [Rhodospirillaceae bacterium]MYF85534.1 TraV family lipoprotein [Rhodospirillaceae bacterium]